MEVQGEQSSDYVYPAATEKKDYKRWQFFFKDIVGSNFFLTTGKSSMQYTISLNLGEYSSLPPFMLTIHARKVNLAWNGQTHDVIFIYIYS